MQMDDKRDVCAHNLVNCPAVICLPRMAILSSFGGKTSLVNIMRPRSIFPILLHPLSIYCFIYFSVAITIIIIPYVLSFVNNKAGGIDDPFVLVGRKFICCVCRSTSTAYLAPLSPSCRCRSPTGDKPWYLYRGKFAVVYISTFHFG